MSNAMPNPAAPIFAFAGGGTGGHLYPAIAIAAALRQSLPTASFVFFGTQRQIDGQILAGETCQLIRQSLPPLSRYPWRWPGFLLGLRRSSLLCRSRLAADRPAVVIGTGGLGSVPAVREAARAGIPTVLLNPDALPGRANRHVAALADLVLAQWEDTVVHFPPNVPVEVLGCAIRPAFNEATAASGVERFGLDAGRRTLLITGASQGARSINEAVLANCDLLEAQRDWQILHLTGESDYRTVLDAYESRPLHAVVLPFTDHMAEALAVADLVIARAGASTLAEITALGRPSILLPYPYHRDMHQMANARCLARLSAARVVRDAADVSINGPALRAVLAPLMTDAAEREALAAAAQRLGRGDAAARMAEQIIALAVSRGSLCGNESSEPLCEPAQ